MRLSCNSPCPVLVSNSGPLEIAPPRASLCAQGDGHQKPKPPLTVDFLLFSKDQEDIYFMKGAFEEVINYCTMYNNGGIPLPLTPQQRSFCQQEEKRMGSLGLRGQYLWSPAPSFKFEHNTDFSSALMQGSW